jgi:hypothetical protein
MACVFFRLFQDDMLSTPVSSGAITDEMILNIAIASGKLPARWWHTWNNRNWRSQLPSTEQRAQWLRKLALKDDCTELMRDMLRLEPGERICAAQVVARLPYEWLLAIEEAPEFCPPFATPPSQEERDQIKARDAECKRMVQESLEKRRLNDPNTGRQLPANLTYGPNRPSAQQQQHQMGPPQGQFHPQNTPAVPPIMQPQGNHVQPQGNYEQPHIPHDNQSEDDCDHCVQLLRNLRLSG